MQLCQFVDDSEENSKHVENDTNAIDKSENSKNVPQDKADDDNSDLDKQKYNDNCGFEWEVYGEYYRN